MKNEVFVLLRQREKKQFGMLKKWLELIGEKEHLSCFTCYQSAYQLNVVLNRLLCCNQYCCLRSLRFSPISFEYSCSSCTTSCLLNLKLTTFNWIILWKLFISIFLPLISVCDLLSLVIFYTKNKTGHFPFSLCNQQNCATFQNYNH